MKVRINALITATVPAICELYFDLGGAETLIGDTILDYETPKSGNCTDGLTNLITNFIDTIQAEETYYFGW